MKKQKLKTYFDLVEKSVIKIQKKSINYLQNNSGKWLKYFNNFLQKTIRLSTSFVIYSIALGATIVAKTYKILHFHLAHKPHVHLTSKYQNYKAWHEWEKHQKVHFAVLGTYLLFIGALVFTSYQKVLAVSDLFDTWDFATPSEYVLDEGLEVFGNSVRMKAQNYEDDANTMGLYHLDESSGTTAGLVQMI